MMKSRVMTLVILGLIIGSGCQPAETHQPTEPQNGTDVVIETVGVSGSEARFPVSIESTIGPKKDRLVLTGTALRERFLVNVYTIGSYLQDGVTVTSADELVNQDCCKQLHLKMETSITGKQMADALTVAVRKSHPAPEFDAELAALSEQLQTCDIAKGAHIWLTNVPGAGLLVNVAGKLDIKINSPAFSKAIWGVYLGKNGLGESIKKGLVSRIK
ncbi:MAG: chalcone isomerase family protein [Planctomycetes bacterium]|nr:chalcone isomerase family protein [Planctomycetota bacterium]